MAKKREEEEPARGSLGPRPYDVTGRLLRETVDHTDLDVQSPEAPNPTPGGEPVRRARRARPPP